MANIPSMPPTTGLDRAPLRTQIRRRLLDGLISGRWAPGERIVERQVAAELEVSQAPVREAIRELEALGLLTSVPNKGVRVRDLELADIREFYAVRAALEELAANEATVRLAGDTAPLEEFAAALHADADSGDSRAQIEHAIAFHRAIVAASGNRLLLNMWESLGIEVWTTLSLRIFRVNPRVNANDHEDILRAFRDREPTVGRLVREHVLSYGPPPED